MDMMSRIDSALAETGLSDPKIAERLQQLADELGVKARGISRESVRQWRSDPDKMPNAAALYLVARLTGRPMRWFVDGTDDATKGLTDDEVFVLRTWQSQRIDAEEAARRLASGAPGPLVDAGELFRLLGSADLTGLTRRRLGRAGAEANQEDEGPGDDA